MTPLQVENSLDKLHLIKNLIIGGAAVSESLKENYSKTQAFKPPLKYLKLTECQKRFLILG
jgi:O-succinylbenzoic acid--CoA ligase